MTRVTSNYNALRFVQGVVSNVRPHPHPSVLWGFRPAARLSDVFRVRGWMSRDQEGGYFVGDGLAVGHGEGGALAVAGVAVALRVDDVDGGGSAGVAALEAEGGRLGTLAADGGGVAEDAPFATYAATSAVLAWATGVGDALVVIDLDGEAHFQFFHGGVHGVGDACLDGVDAVLIGAGTHATAEGFVS